MHFLKHFSVKPFLPQKVAMVSNMIKITLKDVSLETEYEFSEQVTIDNIREFAAIKLGCQSTNLNVRMFGKSAQLKPTKTFADLGITENHALIVSKTTRNLPKKAFNKVRSGTQNSMKKYNISDFMSEANKNHNEVIGHVEANREQLETMNNNMLELMSRKKGNLSEQDVTNIPKLSDQELIAKKMSVNKISGVCSHKVIIISLKNNFAKLSV